MPPIVTLTMNPTIDENSSVKQVLRAASSPGIDTEMIRHIMNSGGVADGLQDHILLGPRPDSSLESDGAAVHVHADLLRFALCFKLERFFD